MISKEFFKTNGLGIGIILLLFLLYLAKDLHLDLWIRISRALFSTSVLVIAFRVSNRLYAQLEKNDKQKYSLVFLFIGLNIASFLVNISLLDPHEIVEREKKHYIAVILLKFMPVFPVAISMMFSWAHYLFKKNKENELAISKLIALNKESELTELKKQLNPHFLFNALSNIYSIAYLKDDRTPDKIMQLSKMLRYVIYDTDVPFIRLDKEIEYIEYYVDFQKFKIKKTQDIKFDYSGVKKELTVAPLIFLPFIENAFKHSQVTTDSNAWVNINMSTIGNVIKFKVENSISTKTQPEILNNNGIGLENIKKRLELIYKDRAELNITKDEVFVVNLKIKVDV
ncbi:histidine kinase [bacterium SCSIO 12643]|nr:histidine kinase [bacterium SCSIO 12643]